MTFAQKVPNPKVFMFKIDLHTHSSASPDGGITPKGYASLINDGVLDFVAVTDHNTIAGAQDLQRSLGDRIIIGEEITCLEGELIGLFLNKKIIPGLTALDTAKAIRAQGGIVYVPHPLETVRKGLTKDALDTIESFVDIVEVHNGRAVFQNRGPKAHTWARLNGKVVAASSDAHGATGIGHTYSSVAAAPTAANLVKLMSKAHFVVKRPPLHSLFYPKYHRLRKKVERK